MPEDKTSSSRQFFSHLPTIAAAAVGSVCAAVLSSFLGGAGTMTGMVLGSVTLGTVSWWADRGFRRANAAARARAEAIKRLGRPLDPDETQVITQTAKTRHDRASRRRWGTWAAVIVAVFAACAVSVTAIELAAGRPLSDVVTGHAGHGTTLGGGGGPGPAGSSPAATAPGSAAPTPTARTSTPEPAPDTTSAAPRTSEPASPSAVQSAISSAVSSAVSHVASHGTSQVP
jgi:hypothetical protein